MLGFQRIGAVAGFGGKSSGLAACLGLVPRGELWHAWHLSQESNCAMLALPVIIRVLHEV